MKRLGVMRGDITMLAVDAIVNAANEAMLGGAGVDGAIHKAAGPELLDACRAVPEVRPGVRCPTGESRITPAFDLDAEHIIHTVGPVWRGGENGERDLLASCYNSALALAAENSVKSVAFPAISCGVYRYPVHAAAEVAVDAVTAHFQSDTSVEMVTLVAFEPEVLAALKSALGQF